MNTTLLKFNDITIVINECEPNKQDPTMNNAYISYHRNGKAIRDWVELSYLEAKCVTSLVNIFCEENKLVKWQY